MFCLRPCTGRYKSTEPGFVLHEAKEGVVSAFMVRSHLEVDNNLTCKFFITS